MSQSPEHLAAPGTPKAGARAAAPARIRSLVAVGDSFTEGLADAYPGPGGPAGPFRGWADLVADHLAGQAAAEDAGAAGEPFRYANLAVRGKLIGQILRDQVPPAALMGADLVTLAGGLNDIMRPGCDVEAVCADLVRCADILAAQSGTLVLFRSIDFSRRMKSGRRLVPKMARLSETVDQAAGQYGAIVVDLGSARVFDDTRLWAPDRIHLSADGHRRVAAAVLEALGRPTGFDWRAPLAPRPEPNRLARTGSDAVWLAAFLAPWIKRRLTGRSSGDGVAPKRPELTPLAPPTARPAGAAPAPAAPETSAERADSSPAHD
ncbi:MAG TPA: SGNH/GDSL hydrolase family protein [Actinocrinis sp.]|nr:SGNH/GDSL hydrolase family protein [Actinocrinis sp.]